MTRNPNEPPLFQSDRLDAEREAQLQKTAVEYTAGRLALTGQQLHDPRVISFISEALAQNQRRATELIAV